MAKRKPPFAARRGRPKPDAGRPARDRPAKRRPEAAPGGGDALWLYGAHAVLAALANPRRQARRLLVTAEAAERQGAELNRLIAAGGRPLAPERAGGGEIATLLPEGAVHQGLALLTRPLAQPALPDLLSRIAAEGALQDGEQAAPIILALDQVTDPQNVGAILRSASAFGARAVLATWRHAALESGALAKAASGALEHLPYIQEGNLARALDQLKAAGFWILGLAAEGETPLHRAPRQPTVLVLGAEGRGLRRLTRERCDLLVRLPTQGPIGHLNVSNAAAVALYELLGRQGSSDTDG